MDNFIVCSNSNLQSTFRIEAERRLIRKIKLVLALMMMTYKRVEEKMREKKKEKIQHKVEEILQRQTGNKQIDEPNGNSNIEKMKRLMWMK